MAGRAAWSRDTKGVVLKKVVLAVVAVVALAIPALAAADSCANVSRPGPDCGLSCTTVVSDGNWIWLPSLSNIGIPGLPPVWGFAPPGADDSVGMGLPGANGNYTNGQTSSLLGMSNNCPPGNNTNRQTTHGIQSGCVA
jgi:hypothetical protein